MKVAQVLFPLAGGAALVFSLCASKCEQTTEIIPYVKEICTDNIDNDGDGLIDCQDSDCDVQCAVTIQINPIAPIAAVETLTVTGTHYNATGIALTVTPSGTGGTAIITGNTWTGHLTLLSDKTTYTVTAIASDAQGRKDTASVQFEKNQ